MPSLELLIRMPESFLKPNFHNKGAAEVTTSGAYVWAGFAAPWLIQPSIHVAVQSSKEPNSEVEEIRQGPIWSGPN